MGALGTFQCHVGDGGDAEAPATNCPLVGSGSDQEETKCSGPNFVPYGGYVKADEAYRCGDCLEVGTDCKVCSDAALCNPILEVHSYKCTQFKIDDAKKFVAEEAVSTCNSLAADEAVCNSNGAEAGEDYVVLHLGCGPCAEGTTAADSGTGVCVDCKGDNCNSATTITAFVFPLLALFYTLL